MTIKINWVLVSQKELKKLNNKKIEWKKDANLLLWKEFYTVTTEFVLYEWIIVEVNNETIKWRVINRNREYIWWVETKDFNIWDIRINKR